MNHSGDFYEELKKEFNSTKYLFSVGPWILELKVSSVVDGPPPFFRKLKISLS